MQPFQNLRPYFGDIHSHCGVGYGHGSLEDAFANARLQLDFAAVTVHGWWPDMPSEDPRLDEVSQYHRQGFERTARDWQFVREVVEANYEPGRFVTFPAFEWHSMTYGDHNVYYKSLEGEILRAQSLPQLRQSLRRYQARGVDGLVMPHHIGYRQGYRGINWAAFNPEFSPAVEIMSMHGCAESAEAPYPYLHTMGPRDYQGTYQYGLAQGHVAGVLGSTDHHSAHPGSYGHGRLALWARELTRQAIWEAICRRRTVALTGDNIVVAFTLNGHPLGSVAPATGKRVIEIAVDGGDTIDYVELLHNNHVLRRWSPAVAADRDPASWPWDGPLKLHVEVGWGEKDVDETWEVTLEVGGGELLDVEPRFRGHDIVAPQAEEKSAYAFSRWGWAGANGVTFETRTWGNPTTTSSGTQGLCLTVRGRPETQIRGTANGVPVSATLGELLDGPRAHYLGGFLTPAFYFHRAVPQSQWQGHFTFEHEVHSDTREWYYVRVRQKNNQWAWTSPIWVG